MFEVGFFEFFFLYFLEKLLDVVMWQNLPMDRWTQKTKKSSFYP